jgi:[ribosomal protein S5]-alanine N-acetyltransferase
LLNPRLFGISKKKNITADMNVKLRSWKKEDIPSLAVLANNKNVWDNLRDHFPIPYTIKDAHEWVHLHEGKKPVVNFAIEVNGKLAGGTGIVLKEDIYRRSAEIGYWLAEEYWGKGIMSETVRQLLEIIQKEHPKIIRVYAETFDFNKASMRVLEKNGFYLESVRKKAVVKNNIVMDDYVWVKILA